jgi:flagellar basal body rod protein FlgG
MLISNAATRALDEIAARERDVLHAFAPGAMPEHGDVTRPASSQPTIDPLSVALPADTYFLTSDDRGRSLFTRNGSFSMNGGTLVDAQGRAILGYANSGATLAPLTADPVDAALGFTLSARIEQDGSITYERSTIDPRTGRRETQRIWIGRLALARFAAGTKLQVVDAQHAAAPPGIVPHVGYAGDGNFGSLTINARESSSIDIDASLERLQEAYVALDAIRAAGDARGNVVKTTMDLLK